MIANSVAVDDSDAGACARGRPKDYRQAKGGPKGGLNSPENINLLICNIYLVKCGAPHTDIRSSPFFKGFAELNLPPCFTRPNRGVY